MYVNHRLSFYSHPGNTVVVRETGMDITKQLCPIEYEWGGKAATGYFCFAAANESLSMGLQRVDFLGEEEMTLLKGKTGDAAINDWLIGRYAAKQVLMAHAQRRDLQSLQILSGSLGQPIPEYQGVGNVNLSLSHTNGVGVAALSPSDVPIGIDLERISCGVLSDLGRYFGRDEFRVARSVSQDDDEAALLLWSVKEALSKALRCGLVIPMEFLEISELISSNNEGYASFSFVHFPHFRAISWIMNGYMVSFVGPSNVSISMGCRILR